MLVTISPQEYPPYAEWKGYEIENTVSIVSKDNPPSKEITFTRLVQKLFMSEPLTGNKNKVTEIAQLKDNWDGYGAIPPYKEVVNNSYRFLDSLFENGIRNIEREDIYPTTYGSIVIEINNARGLVSVEIGKQKLGFFTEYENNKDILSEGEATDFHSIPENLQKALDILYDKG